MKDTNEDKFAHTDHIFGRPLPVDWFITGDQTRFDLFICERPGMFTHAIYALIFLSGPHFDLFQHSLLVTYTFTDFICRNILDMKNILLICPEWRKNAQFTSFGDSFNFCPPHLITNSKYYYWSFPKISINIQMHLIFERFLWRNDSETNVFP